MSVLTYLVEAKIAPWIKELDGQILTRPALMVADGTGLTWGADVDIGQKHIDPNNGDEVIAPLRNVAIANGVRELVYADAGSAVRLRRSGSGRFEIVGFSKRRPGTYTRVSVTIPELCFPEVDYYSPPGSGPGVGSGGSPPDTGGGGGFGGGGGGGGSGEIPPIIIGPPTPIGLSSRRLTYAELDTYGGYGVVPYGAIGIFEGDTLVELR